MASFNYMNNTAPFWDFLASLEQKGNNHPFFTQKGNDEVEDGEDHEGQHPPPFDPWGWGHQFFGGERGMPHRGPPGPPGPRGPPPGPHGPPPHHDGRPPRHERDGEKDGERTDNDNGEGPSGSGSESEEEHAYGRGHHGRCGGRKGRHGPEGRCGFGPRHGGPGHHGPRGHHGPHDGPGHRGPRGPHHGPPGPHEGSHGGHHGHCGPRGFHGPPHHGPPHHGGPGRRGPWGRGGHCGGPSRGFGGFGGFGGPGFDPSALAAQFFEAFAAEHPSNKNNDDTTVAVKDTEDFKPEADIFDTTSAYIIHVSLPGAKKEDVGVNWDAEKSELSVAGVIYRPGDEELLKTLAMNERKAGPFERKIRLGTRANPARVDAEGITAKLEDGILRIEVRKEEEDFVEIKKVDIE